MGDTANLASAMTNGSTRRQAVLGVVGAFGVQNLLTEARKRPEIGFVYSGFDPRIPQIEFQVDRDKVKSLDEFPRFLRTLDRKGKARTTITCELHFAGEAVGHFDGEFVALRI